MKRCVQNFWIVGTVAIASLAASQPIVAQIIPDTTLPVNSRVTPNANTSVITNGTTAGVNLFHSFRDFSVLTGNTAYFNNALNIQNIITRVTGSSISNIDGILKANGGANLFLINPNGIIFGPNASLNIGGSFLASSASSIKFADGSEFSATNSNAPPLLTINVPIGLQFGPNPGRIVVQGTGNNLSLAPEILNTITDNRPVGLQVPDGQTLALVGGEVALEAGNITAHSGRIELGSVGASSYVSLNPFPSGIGWSLGYSEVQNFSNISLSNASSADISGNGSGNMQVRSQNLTLSDGSAILALNEGSNSGGKVEVNTTESVELIGGITADSQYTSNIAIEVQPEATGNGGDLTIETGRLIVRDGAQIGANTYGAGSGGTLTVKARDSVEAIGESADGFIGSGLFAGAQAGTGDGGNLTIETGRLIVRDGAQISTTTFDAGSAGTLTVRATDSVEAIGVLDAQFASGLTAATVAGTGDGGDLIIETGRLIVRDGAQINASTFGAGKGGSITIRASDSVEAIGESADGFIGSGLFAGAQAGTGDGGDLTIETGRLIVRDGATISSGTFSAGAGGTITVRARDSVEAIGTSADGQHASGLTADTGGTGDGGDLTIETGRLIVRDGAQITASTSGAGRGGTLTVRARDSVEAIATSVEGQYSSGLFAGAQAGTGDGGDLTIETGRLIVRDGATISSDTFSAGRGGNITVRASDSVEAIGVSTDGQTSSGLSAAAAAGTGDGGDLTIETGRLILRDGAQINASTFSSGRGGTLTVRASDSVEAIGESAGGRAASGLFTGTFSGTGDGGDLTIETGRLIVRDGATVNSSTFNPGKGGSITVRARDSIELSGTSADGRFPSRLVASALAQSTGEAGNITVETGQLIIRDKAQINVRSQGTGLAGNMVVNAGAIRLDNQGALTAETGAGGGNITVNSRDIQLRRTSNINTNATGTSAGGNITLNTDTLAALENSDITANSEESFGGRVVINAQGIFGTEFRSNTSDLTSDITASSALGADFSGTVEINTPDVAPAAGLLTLPSGLVDVSRLIASECEAFARGSSFIVTGKGGLPPNPAEPLDSTAVVVDWATLEGRREKEEVRREESPISNAQSPIVEATGWARNDKGQVVLVANAPTGNSDAPWYRSPSCQGAR